MISRIKLHKKGPEFSRLVYGAWRLTEDPNGISSKVVLKKIETCLDLGITTFDHADIYGNYTCEEIFGNALKTNKSLYKKIELVSKCAIMLVSENRPENKIKHYNTKKQHIISSVERSLKNLGAEKLDLLLIHRPNPILDPVQVAEAFESLLKSGKVLHFGVSNFLPHQFNTLEAYLDFPLVTNQVEINPLRLDTFLDGTLDHSLKKKIAVMAWSPFAGGRIFKRETEKANKVALVLDEIAQRENCNLEEVILKWLTFTPHKILPIIGTNQVDRILACKNFESIQFTDQDWFRIYTASLGEDVP